MQLRFDAQGLQVGVVARRDVLRGTTGSRHGFSSSHRTIGCDISSGVDTQGRWVARTQGTVLAWNPHSGVGPAREDSTADWHVNYNFIGSTGIWYIQILALVAGHVSGLTLAHDRALATYRSTNEAVRSQYWMLTVMVAFTSFGLWLRGRVAAR